MPDRLEPVTIRQPLPLPLLVPDWPAPHQVRACTTTRIGGCSTGPYHALNLAEHVADDAATVERNRELLRHSLSLPAVPIWLRQEHGTRVIDAAAATAERGADGSFTTQPGFICAVLTADCVPILLCDRAGTRVAALHGGWRGLLDGIIAQGVAALEVVPASLLAWIGPAIGAAAYFVQEDLRQHFIAADAGNQRFFAARAGRLTFDLTGYCAARLAACGVTSIHQSGRCTYSEPETFYSYRREPITGRMATLIWLQY